MKLEFCLSEILTSRTYEKDFCAKHLAILRAVDELSSIRYI